MEQQRQQEHERNWEQMGAASGLLAMLLFVVAFIIFLSTDPSGGNEPPLPNLDNAEAAPAFFAFHLEAIRAQVLLNSIGIVFFLWFLGSLWAVLRSAEGSPGRGSATAAAGAIVGVAVTLQGLVVQGTSTLTTSLAQAEVVPTLYTEAALSFALGGAAFTVFFLGVAEVILRTGAMARWLGVLALLAAVFCAFGFVTPYATSGIFNPATGALGFYAHYIAIVVWVFLASAVLTLAERRRARVEAPAPPAVEPRAGNEGVAR